MAGIVGQPVVNEMIYVDAVNGSDSAKGGRSWSDAYATLSQAHSAATTNNYDVIVVAPAGTGSGSAVSETTAVTFSKGLITVVGAAPAVDVSPRNRVLVGTGGSLEISGDGNRFIGLQLACFVDINVPFTLSGERNHFINCHIAGMGIQAAGDDTAARSLYINDGDENTFDGVYFGVDTVERGAANYTIEMAGGVQRTTFRHCMFTMWSDAQTPVHIKSTGGAGLDRWQRFHDCVFYNMTTNDAAKADAVFDLSAQTSTADILMTGHNVHVGFDDWEAVNSSNLWFQGYTNTANVVGIGINPSVS